MAYTTTLQIQPNTLTDLTVEVKHNLGVNTYTLSDFTVSGDNLEGYITYLHTSNQVTISSTGYHTVVTDISAITNTVVTLDFEFSNFEANSTKYYCKDETARNSITDINTALDTKLNTADVWYDSTTSTLNIGVAQV